MAVGLVLFVKCLAWLVGSGCLPGIVIAAFYIEEVLNNTQFYCG